MLHIHINNSLASAKNIDLPCLIHGQDKSGASFFTMNMVLNYLREGKKVLFYSAFAPARDFLVENTAREIHEVVTSADQYSEKQLVIPLSGDQTLFAKILQDDRYNDYIKVVKNDELINPEVVALLQNNENVVYSGNFLASTGLSKDIMKSIILFSDLENFGIKDIQLAMYHGLFVGKGIVELN